MSFTHTGGIAAYDAQLRDSFPTGSSYSLLGIELNGTLYTASNLPAGVTFGTSGGLGVDFAKLNVGDQVKVTYQVTLPNLAAIASSNATLTWTSLPESFNSWGGSSVGSDGSAEGERTGAGASPNTYILSDAAGLGLIQGTLWDDTASATTSAIPDGPGLAGQTVTLTWAGLDGNLDSSADNKVFTTTTDANGRYHFGVLPSGVFRIDVPSGTVAYPQPLGELRVRIDSDAGSALGRIDINLGEGSSANADAGFVQLNDAPVNQLPGTQNGFEDTPLAIGGIRVSDVDIGNGIMDITLSVLHGTLSLSALPAGVSVVGNGSGTLSLSGNLTALNQALANLVYLGNANFNGIDTLTVLSNDRGGFGDGDGDGLPGQNPQDARTDQDSLQIILAPVNDAPLAVDDAIDAVEAGGTNNRLPGVNPSGNLLRNDQDVDIATNADVLRVSAIGLEGQPAQNLASGSAVVISGRYGSLIVSSSGGFLYLVDNNNAEVQALRLAGQTLVERFVYTATDLAGASSSAALTVTVHGANDTPVAVNDEGIAVEAGGVANGTAGSDATGNVLSNDTDVDAADQLQVVGIRTGSEAATGTGGSVGQPLAGRYGTLVINADGSYRYQIDLSNPEVLAAAGLGRVLQDVFTYTVGDRAGATDLAQLVIDLDIAAPFIPAPAGPHLDSADRDRFGRLPLPTLEPAIFVTPVVEQDERDLELSGWAADGSDLSLGRTPEIRSATLKARLGLVPGQFVASSVAQSRNDSEQDLAWMLGRHGRLNLSADGLLADPSVFASSRDNLTRGDSQLAAAAENRTAPGLRAQLREAAQRLRASADLPTEHARTKD
ncbi:VCBS domain-containing protein [Pseudomonas sp. NPDC087612]|uniref:VCBS domain-containing protein n=1 Tax=Pseudomonas sp. NPDC087612 TaxID=3364441 RepID=UPI0037FF8F4B